MTNDISITSRALKIRSDWSDWNLSGYTDEELVKVWNEWYLTPDAEEGQHETYIEDLIDQLGTRD